MNPNFNGAIVAERMQALQAKADTAARPGTRLASGARRLRCPDAASCPAPA